MNGDTSGRAVLGEDRLLTGEGALSADHVDHDGRGASRRSDAVIAGRLSLATEDSILGGVSALRRLDPEVSADGQ
ncbi:MAG: hypothetical protein ACSLE8_18285 [Rhodococcus sp. (in: high G+C Gram-positive bacteria)]